MKMTSAKGRYASEQVHPATSLRIRTPSSVFSANHFRSDIIARMVKNVRFVAVKTIKKPTTVKFKTKSGETVSFKAVKTVKQKQTVHFRAKRK